MPTNIDNVQDYTGNIALRSNASTFPQDAEDQYTYLAELSQDLNVTVNQMNTAISETSDNAISAEESKDAAKASEDAATISAAEAFDSEQAAANSASSSSSSASSSSSSANASATSALESSGFADDAEISAQQAAISATEAKTYRDQASEISGLDTVTEAVDLALSESYQYAMTKAEFFANAEQRKRESAGSGFLEFGKGLVAEAVNLGLNGSTTVANTMYLGGGTGGTSRTTESIQLINGVQHKVSSIIKFPDAEKGTRSYDSATGEIIDYLTDVDPKYGDVAADLNEAVARNFEGLVKNGDFRLGTQSWNAFNSSATVANNGVTLTSSGEGVGSRLEQEISELSEAGWLIEAEVLNPATNTVWARVSTTVNDPDLRVDVLPMDGFQKISFTTTANSITYLRFYPAIIDGSTQSIQVRNISIRKVTNQPILSRQDFCFLETFHEKVSDKGVVFPLGNVQYGTTTYKGIPLQATNTPQGYSAFGEWDSTTAGYSAVWANLTAVQQKIFLDDPDNNLYFDAEANELIQVPQRVRVVKGVGNDYPCKTLPQKVTGASARLQRASLTAANNLIYAQGIRDVSKDTGSSSDVWFTDLNGTTTVGEMNVWKVTDSRTNIAHNGLCFALPICLVQRGNQGAYHPVYNPDGFAKWVRKTSGGVSWYASDIATPTATADAFRISNGNNIVGKVPNGHIVSGASGRSDQYEFYDAIYAGQVQDLRLNANKQDANRLLEDAIRKAVAGETRGVGKVVFTKPHGTETLLSPEYDSLPWVDFVGSAATFDAKFTDGATGKYIGDEAGVSTVYQLSRKSNSSSAKVVIGSTLSTVAIDTTNNMITLNVPLGEVALINYESLSNFTEPDANTAVYGEIGNFVENTSASQISKGNRLHGSLLGTIGKGTADNERNNIDKLDSTSISFASVGDVAPANGSDKLLTSVKLIEKDGLIYDQYNAVQAIHNGADWGNDGEIAFVDNETTVTDLNGTTVKAVTHTSTFPVGIADKTQSN